MLWLLVTLPLVVLAFAFGVLFGRRNKKKVEAALSFLKKEFKDATDKDADELLKPFKIN